ncbi:glycosyltransferase family 2 protein [Sulfurovum lithotrophicum]|uniref:glycosyltransferase family 2 protein n=1 Tax=Sulfurovum lithotrophicum TaxID=206403 RepID=UPI000A635B6D|nr:glycosyltransferase family 2 protein [Sulfurovum lithotrophicum]
MNKPPLISIAMATYNGEKYLTEQLDSVYAQTYKNIEVIVTDDCSTDETVKILEQYADTHGLKYYVNEENLGFVKNFEKAISLCSGEYIALADQDDIWLPHKLEFLLEKIGLQLMIHSDCSIIDAKNEIVIPSWKKENGFMVGVENLLFKNVVTGCTVLMHRNLLDNACPFPEGVTYHDWWLALCAAEKNSLKYTDECLTRYREHAAQDTGRGDDSPVLKRVYRNVKNRYRNMDFYRTVGYKKHLQNLYVLKKNPECLSGYQTVLSDTITYFENYLDQKIHLKTFYIGMRYHKVLYPYKNYLYVKNILMDIVG